MGLWREYNCKGKDRSRSLWDDKQKGKGKGNGKSNGNDEEESKMLGGYG